MAKKLKLSTGRLSSTMDPQTWAATAPVKLPEFKRILGLDLATNCGASFVDIIPNRPPTEAMLIGGQWNLSCGAHDTQAIRYLRLTAFLELAKPDLIMYEEVKYSGPTNADKRLSFAQRIARAVSGAQIVHGLSAVLLHWAAQRDIPTQGIPIGTLKQHATGKGVASKQDMIRAANAKFGTVFSVDDYESTGADNIADSMFLVDLGAKMYAQGLGYVTELELEQNSLRELPTTADECG